MKLNSKSAIFFNDNRGIGLNTAKALIVDGAKVVIFGRSQ